MINKTKTGYKIIITLLFISLMSGMASAEVPPNATDLEASVNGGWVNYSWAAGIGNVTDTYNVSISVSGAAQTWTNDSVLTSSNNSVGLDEWAEIWVWAYNSTDAGNLSIGYVYADTQADRSTFGELIDLMNAIPTVLLPILAIIVILIVIMAFMSVGTLIMSMIDSVADIILNAIKFKKR